MRNAFIGLWGGLMLAGAVPAAVAAAQDGNSLQQGEVVATSIVAPATSASGVDAKLLGMLKANGSITADQYAELSADLAREQRRGHARHGGQDRIHRDAAKAHVGDEYRRQRRRAGAA